MDEDIPEDAVRAKDKPNGKTNTRAHHGTHPKTALAGRSRLSYGTRSSLHYINMLSTRVSQAGKRETHSFATQTVPVGERMLALVAFCRSFRLWCISWLQAGGGIKQA